MEFEPMLTPREKSPLPKMSPEEDRTRDAVDSEPKHYQLSYFGPAVIKFDRVWITFILALFYRLKPLTSEGGEDTRIPGENPWWRASENATY